MATETKHLPGLTLKGCFADESLNVMNFLNEVVLLSSDPTYIGITGLARIVGIPVHPIPTGEEGLAPAAVAAAIREVRRQGRVPRAVYDIPDFNNPMGTRMPLANRRALLELVHREGVLLFEDNPYGMFAYDGEPLPTLKSFD